MKQLFLLLLALITGASVHACTASFTGTQSPSGSNLLNIAFTNASSYGTPFTGQAKKATIRYGDGNSSTVWSTPLPSHNYASPGTYTAKLLIWSVDSTTMNIICGDSTTITVTVAYPPCGTVISTSGTGATRSFSVTNPAASSGISYSWNFGDGGTGTGSSPSHTYTTTGSYTVTCTSTVTSPACSYVNTLSLYVVTPAPPLACSTLGANFSVTTTGGGSTAVVTNTSTTVSFPYSRRATWSWGDGTSNIAWAPSHAYSATGTYTIKLKMEWQDSLLGTTLCSDSITKTVSITAVAPTNIQGTVMYDTTYGLLPIKVWLIQFNATTNILSAVDSQSFTATAPKNYLFSNKTAGNYLVKAAVIGGPTSGTGVVPTYSYSSAIWSSATTITAVPATTTYAAILMMNGTLTSGPGFIGGNVSLGANKGASGGVSGMTIFLRNSGTQVISWATTNSSGDYSFSNVPTGTYTVYPEALNFATAPAMVTISNGTTTVGNVSFNQDQAKMNIAPRSLAVGGPQTNAANWTVYPNPASGKLTVSWTGLNQSRSDIRIMDIAGKTVLQQQVSGTSGTRTIDISTLRPGLYFIHGTALNNSIEKLVIE